MSWVVWYSSEGSLYYAITEHNALLYNKELIVVQMVFINP